METCEHANAWKRTALITGAAGGLGKAMAVECARRGWDLFLTDMHTAPLDSLSRGLRNAYGVKVTAFPCDLTDPQKRVELFEQLRVLQVRCSMLINAAGIDHEGEFFFQTQHQIEMITRLNIEGTLAMIHGTLVYRELRTPFHIINVSSLAAFYPMPVKATYAASKRFLLDFSLALREEVRSSGITVTVLCPAGMPTTPECIRAIAAQGLAGQLTTMDPGRVAHETIDAALAGKAMVIPGIVNRAIKIFGSLIPARVTAALIHKRWTAAHEKRKWQGDPSPAGGLPTP